MKHDARRRHTREFVETMVGPAVYIVYLMLAYSASAVSCMLALDTEPAVSDGAAAAQIANVVLMLLALSALAGATLLALRRLTLLGKAHRDDQDAFMAILAVALALLSALAVLWTGAATLAVTACT